MKKSVWLVATVAVLLAVVGPAQAEYDRPAGAYFAAIHLGPGWGSASIDASDGNVADTDAQIGGLWGFRIGTALSNIAVLSIDYFGYASVGEDSKAFEELTSQFWVIGPALSWYPGAGGFYLKGLAGWGGVDFRFDDGTRVGHVEEDGLGLIGSAGFELPLNVSFSLGMQADYIWMKVGDLRVADGTGGTEKADFSFTTVGINVFVMFNY